MPSSQSPRDDSSQAGMAGGVFWGFHNPSHSPRVQSGSIIPSPLRPPGPAGVPSGVASGVSGVTAGWPRAGGRGRCPCREPCPREDVTTCFWCALASGCINALLAAGTSCTAGHRQGDGHLDTVGTPGHTWGRDTGHLEQGTGHQLRLTPAQVALLGQCPTLGGLGGQMSHAGRDKPRQAGADAQWKERGSPGLSGAEEAAASRLIANYPRYSVSDTL